MLPSVTDVPHLATDSAGADGLCLCIPKIVTGLYDGGSLMLIIDYPRYKVM